MDAAGRKIWTIGHSTHSIDAFTGLLKIFNIQVIADIRSLPGSRKFPHFNKELLEVSLPASGIAYVHMKELGGRRKVKPDSSNTGWNHPAFRGYADYMETAQFSEAIHHLELLAVQKRTAFMCSEALWWRCHRRMVSDWLKVHGWTVIHISAAGKPVEHALSPVSRVTAGELFYSPT